MVHARTADPHPEFQAEAVGPDAEGSWFMLESQTLIRPFAAPPPWGEGEDQTAPGRCPRPSATLAPPTRGPPGHRAGQRRGLEVRPVAGDARIARPSQLGH